MEKLRVDLSIPTKNPGLKAMVKTMQSLHPYATSNHQGEIVIIYSVMETSYGAVYYEYMNVLGYTDRDEEDGFDKVPSREQIAKNRKKLDIMLSTVQQVRKTLNITYQDFIVKRKKQ